ncbi:adenine deaminase [Brevibacillus fluminis]|uniref:adenine deaminase n=1 Tax=Brevibacillus fluminis TaxID=511487 RepID=A0A3M8CZ78_9BACL|nr:adenine deaminase [Brevibacillus fluminis]
MRIRPIAEDSYLRLIRTARRMEPATCWIKGANVLNVYTREWLTAHVVLAGERIAYVGDAEPIVDERTQIIEGEGYWLVPGYIEPHAHPFQWYTFDSLTDFALATGTTTLVSDTLHLTTSLSLEQVEAILQQLTNHPVKQFFWARLDPQIRLAKQSEAFQKDGLARLLAHPLVLQGGEITDWTGFLAENEEILFGMKHARDVGKRIEGHHPGASASTLAVAAAAGITACHESITAEEVQNRLRLGMYATLRHSSIRPDLPELLAGMKRLGIPFHSSRLMLTSDGSTPPMLRHGFTDYLIKLAIDAGVPDVDAYAMATVNPAQYYGLDAEIGGIAPGRIADILFLRSPHEPTPEKVIANGELWAEGKKLLRQTPKINWSDYRFPQPKERLPLVNEEWFQFPEISPDEPYPLIQMENAVITRVVYERLECDETGRINFDAHPDLAQIVTIDPESGKRSQAIVRGFAVNLQALASSYTVSTDMIVIGREPKAMKQALERVLELGGGIVAMEEGQICFEQELALAGKMSDESMAELIESGEAFVRFMRAKGYRYLDPIYSLFFFQATHLPYVRMTAEGLYDVKKSVVIKKSAPLFE